MFTALASLFMNRPVRPDVAMTGEITLRGLVLPIGGLKEKTLAAARAGIKQVIVPKRNEKDLPDIPQEVRDTLKFHFVENTDEVLAVALGTAAPAAKGRSRPTGRSGGPGPAAPGGKGERQAVPRRGPARRRRAAKSRAPAGRGSP